MQVTVIGTGYVGLVTGTCFAEQGHQVTCVDVDQAKIDGLNQNQLPIFEPGLDDLVATNRQRGRLKFTTDLRLALEGSELVFIAVGTPQHEDGSCNLSYVWAVADQIRELSTTSKIVVVKSTVPVGTNQALLERLNQGEIQHFAASNPEFLREGLAVNDCLQPERIVVGVRDEHVGEEIRRLYGPYVDNGVPLLITTPESSEMTKYAANCLLACRISFINEMANLCEKVGADITEVRNGIGLDSRIGPKFLNAGIGYGGSCFPKDTRALIALAGNHDVPMNILPQVDVVNERQKQQFINKIYDTVGTDLQGTTIALWGLAFKPETDDIREAPALVLIEQLLEAGAQVQVFDPQAHENVQEVFGDRITYFSDKYSVLEGANALVIATDWDDFAAPNWQRVTEALSQPIVIDGRNMYDLTAMSVRGVTYASVGRPTVSATTDARLEGASV